MEIETKRLNQRIIPVSQGNAVKWKANNGS